MNIKIDAPRRYMSDGCAYANKENAPGASSPVRLVSEKDWRKLMKLVRLLEARSTSLFADERDALDALREKAK